MQENSCGREPFALRVIGDEMSPEFLDGCIIIIDPEGILRAMVYYPMTNGRSIDEILRLVTALQTSDANKIATPEGWQPGDKVIVPPPQDMDAANERESEGYECTDWYFCKKAI